MNAGGRIAMVVNRDSSDWEMEVGSSVFSGCHATGRSEIVTWSSISLLLCWGSGVVRSEGASIGAMIESVLNCSLEGTERVVVLSVERFVWLRGAMIDVSCWRRFAYGRL